MGCRLVGCYREGKKEGKKERGESGSESVEGTGARPRQDAVLSSLTNAGVLHGLSKLLLKHSVEVGSDVVVHGAVLRERERGKRKRQA